MQPRTDTQTHTHRDTQTRVTTIHFSWSTTHAKCKKTPFNHLCDSLWLVAQFHVCGIIGNRFRCAFEYRLLLLFSVFVTGIVQSQLIFACITHLCLSVHVISVCWYWDTKVVKVSHRNASSATLNDTCWDDDSIEMWFSVLLTVGNL